MAVIFSLCKLQLPSVSKWSSIFATFNKTGIDRTIPLRKTAHAVVDGTWP
jgi:hypothetical protein